MTINDIFSNSLKYPFSDVKKFILVGIIVVFASLFQIMTQYNVTINIIMILASIITILFIFVLSGYSISVIKKGLENSDEIPDMDFKRNFIDGLKTMIISIIYVIIPVICVILLQFVIFTFHFDLFAASILSSLITIIFGVIFGIFEIVALARFAYNDSVSDAMSYKKVIKDIKSIGIIKIVSFFIIIALIFVIVMVIGGLISLIPYIGYLLGVFFSSAYFLLVFYRSLGLLYSEIL